MISPAAVGQSLGVEQLWHDGIYLSYHYIIIQYKLYYYKLFHYYKTVHIHCYFMIQCVQTLHYY